MAPAEVFAELTKAAAEYPALGTISAQGWLGCVELGEIAEIVAFAQYKHEVGGGSDRNVGESAVLAWVAVNGGIAIIDEAAATSIGDRDGLAICGSMWLIIQGYKQGKLDRPTSEEIVDDLIDSGMWLPVASGAALSAWATRKVCCHRTIAPVIMNTGIASRITAVVSSSAAMDTSTRLRRMLAPAVDLPRRARSAVVDVGAGGSRATGWASSGAVSKKPRVRYALLRWCGNPPWQQEWTSRSTSGVHGLGTKLVSSEPAGQTTEHRPR